MGLGLAIKAFFRAFKDGEGARSFVGGKEQEVPLLEKGDYAHLRLLAMLQHSSRLIDFLQEDISSYTDGQVGAAVRKIHEQCHNNLEEVVTIRPVMEEKEGTKVTVPVGYDPSEIKVVGKVKGEPPFNGILRHKGWKAHKLSLPKQVAETKREVICPAEVELK